MIRKLIKIDENLCDGCGLCIPSCHEGALKIIDGKAKLVRESYCDGLGACLNECPRGALSIIEADTVQFDEQGALDSMRIKTAEKPTRTATELGHEMETRPVPGNGNMQHHAGCPSSRTAFIERPTRQERATHAESQLRQWPIQFHLVSPSAPYFKNAEIALVADCVPFAYAQFHDEILAKYPIAIGCPKLDDLPSYFDKLVSIIKESSPRLIRVLIMEVPCCSGLLQIAREAVAATKSAVPVELTVIGIRGKVIGSRNFTIEQLP